MPGSQNPVAIITAASKGMGRACAEELGRRGYRVVLLARSESVTALASQLGGEAVTGSVTHPADIDRAVATAMESFGRVDAVVNNTGHPPKGPLLEISDDEWHGALDLLLLSVVRMARAVTPIMRQQGGGSLVNISTVAAEEPSLVYPLSSALRAGLAAFAKLFATEYAAANIRMNNILPGFIDSHPVPDDVVATIPLARPGTVAEIAKTAAFLLSEDAAYITGQNIRVDGGLGRSL